MDRIRALHNPVRDYEWGSRTALARLQGREAPTPRPEAELWMGAHPASPSSVLHGGTATPLDAWIARDPRAALGRRDAQRFDGTLPFLFKVLAPERALSIQTHPSAEQARRGYARENAAGIAPDDPRRSYRDPNPKPELVCALERFEVLCGLRTPAALRERLAALALPPSPLHDALREAPSAQAAFRAWLTAAHDARQAFARQAVAAARAARTADPALAWLERLAEQQPDDPGVVAPLLLEHLVLEPGEALFLEAGQIHAYLRGTAVELMANSDNVLRCGLTPKHVDPEALLETMHFREGAPQRLRAQPDARAPGLARYATPAPQFELGVLALGPGEQRAIARPDASAEIWLCTEGEARLVDPRDGAPQGLARGASAWLPAALPALQVAAGEAGARIHVARVPH